MNSISTEGNSSCPCTDVSSLLSSLTDRSCILPPSNATKGEETVGVLMTVEGHASRICLPHTFGSSVCETHERQPLIDHDLECVEGGWLEPELCTRKFCYVDAEKCRNSEERMYRSLWFPQGSGVDLFYSYTTCDAALNDYTRNEQKTTLGGITITATAPIDYFPPYIFKRDIDGKILGFGGDEYYNDTVPYEGILVDYLKELQTISEDDFNVSYTFGSKASLLVHPSSTYNAVIGDVEDGLVDMGVGDFLVTGERLQMSSFVPLYQSRHVLVIPKPDMDESLGAQISKVLEPFTVGAWAMVLAIIFVVSLFSVWFSDRQKIANRIGTRYSSQAAKPTARQRRSLLARLALDSFLEKGAFFCSSGIEKDSAASLPYKILMFGFGFFILIVCAAYVANLAAFLTRSVPNYIGSMEAAVANGKSICALPVMRTAMEAAYPNARFVFSEVENSYLVMLDDYKAKKCDFLVVVMLHAIASSELMAEFCDLNLVFTESVVIENQVGFPLQTSLKHAGLSYWIYMAEKYHGITVQNMIKTQKYDNEYSRQPGCETRLSAHLEVGHYVHISPKNLFFPCIFFLTFACIASCIQCWHQRNLDKGVQSAMGRPSMLLRTASVQRINDDFHLGFNMKTARNTILNARRCLDSAHDDEDKDLEVQSPQVQVDAGDIKDARRRPSDVIVTNNIGKGSFGLDAEEDIFSDNGLVVFDKSDRTADIISNGIVALDKSNRIDAVSDETVPLSDNDAYGKEGLFTLDEVLACMNEMKTRRRKKVRFS